MVTMNDTMKQDFLNAQQEWADAQLQSDAAKTLQKEIIDELHEKYPDVSKSDISWVFNARFKNNADEQETKFEDKKDCTRHCSKNARQIHRNRRSGKSTPCYL